jgi:hypothetical protein
MSKRVTIVTLQIRVQTPEGSNTAEMLAFIREAIEAKVSLDKSLAPKVATSRIDLEDLVVKLVKKETTYG